MLRKALELVLCMALVSFAYAVGASALSFALATSADPSALRPGDPLTVHVGLDEPTQLAGYVIDLRFDESELALTGAAQQACLSFSEGSCSDTPPFNIDPMDPASAATGRRASALSVPPSFLETDAALTGAPINSLFSLSFEAGEGLAAGDSDDLVAGILDSAADDLTARDATSLVPSLSSTSTSLKVAPVPEPSTLGLALFGLGGLVAVQGRHRRAHR